MHKIILRCFARPVCAKKYNCANDDEKIVDDSNWSCQDPLGLVFNNKVSTLIVVVKRKRKKKTLMSSIYTKVCIFDNFRDI